jgi:CheY-like chemotaxis protein
VAEQAKLAAELANHELRRALNGILGDAQILGKDNNLSREFKPHVILMDIRMPVMDGLTATRRLRKLPLGREVVILVISARAFDHNRQQSLDAGCSNFIAKPFCLERLLSLLQSHLGLSLRDEDEAAETKEHAKEELPDQKAIVVIPPAAELLTLLDLAKRGNIRRIEKQAGKLAQLDEQYLPFANELRQFAKGFKMKQIEQFLKEHIKEC